MTQRDTGSILDDKYEILERLATGGMGEVWRARHIHLHELRVIKILRADRATDGAFRTYKIRVGKATVVATADGYNPARLEVQVAADGTVDAPLKLEPRTTIVPGTLRGTVKDDSGRPLAGAARPVLAARDDELAAHIEP